MWRASLCGCVCDVCLRVWLMLGGILKEPPDSNHAVASSADQSLIRSKSMFKSSAKHSAWILRSSSNVIGMETAAAADQALCFPVLF